MRFINVEYKRFAQHYIEMFDIWGEHQLTVNALREAGEEIPDELANELVRHSVIVTILEDTALKVYGKNHEELFSDAVVLESKPTKGRN
jgi:helix-turn-helix protein